MNVNRSRMSRCRAMMLGFLVCCSAVVSAQDKPAIERMNARVAEWQAAPTDRFIGFEVAFPTNTEEAKTVGNNAFVLITAVSKKREEATVSGAFVLQGEKQFEMTAFGSVPVTQLGSTGFFRSDRIFLLPLKWLANGAAVQVTAGSHFESVSLGPLPASPVVSPPDAPLEFPAKNVMAVSTLMKRDFPSLELDPVKVRVSSGVAQGLLIKQVPPHYPVAAKAMHISGTVVLVANITQEGKIANLRVISGPPELVDAAIEAVRQWEYRPYLLAGRPVMVETTITVNFVLR